MKFRPLDYGRPLLFLTLLFLSSYETLAYQPTLALGSGTTYPGGSITLNITLTSSGGAQPQSLQWTMGYGSSAVTSVSVTPGAITKAAGKTLTCFSTASTTDCVVEGIGTTVIGNGVVATATFWMAAGLPNGPVPVSMTPVFAADINGNGIPSSGTGGAITIQQPQTWSISGTVSPLPGGAEVKMTLPGAGSATTTTDSSGNYKFSGLANGNYTVTPSKKGYTFNPTSRPVTVNGGNVTGVNFTQSHGRRGGITIDVSASKDQQTPSLTVTSPPFSTTSGNELLLAFVSADYISGQNTTVTSVSGGGLTWQLVVRTNVYSGTSEIWRAFASRKLQNVRVTARLSQSVVSSITVMTYSGVNTSGTHGSGAIGATASGHARRGAPVAQLTTSQNNSWVFGVGNDYDNAIGRTVGPNQSLVHQDFSSTSDTYWVQMQNTPTPLRGTVVKIKDTAPTEDQYNLSICEILAGGY